jgi:hypothetical protein
VREWRAACRSHRRWLGRQIRLASTLAPCRRTVSERIRGSSGVGRGAAPNARRLWFGSLFGAVLCLSPLLIGLAVGGHHLVGMSGQNRRQRVRLRLPQSQPPGAVPHLNRPRNGTLHAQPFGSGESYQVVPVTSSGCFQPVPTDCSAWSSACRCDRGSRVAGTRGPVVMSPTLGSSQSGWDCRRRRRGPQVRQERGRAAESIARSAPCGAAAPLPRGAIDAHPHGRPYRHP